MKPRGVFPRARFEYWAEEARAHWWRLVWLRAYERGLLAPPPRAREREAFERRSYALHRHEKAAAGRWIRAKESIR